MDIDAVREQASDAIKPLKPSDSDTHGRYRTQASHKLPEHYLVYFLLVDLLGFHNLGKADKVAWSIPVDLEGRKLSIGHWKMGLGLFSSTASCDETAANEIVRLICRGVRVAQPYFNWRAEKAVIESKVNIRNKSNVLYDRFQFLLNLYEAKRSELESNIGKIVEIAPQDGSRSFILPKYQLSREVEWLALSVIESFFSWTEHVFVHLSVLQGKCVTGDCVKNLSEEEWKVKFKTALDINEPEIKRYYDELISTRNQVRNFVAHGAFGKKREAFLFHSDVGAVPVQLPHLEGYHSYRFRNSLGFPQTERGSSDHETITLIQEFVRYIRSGSLAPAWIYLDSGEDLVLTMAQSGEYRLAMQSEEAMKEFTEYFTYLSDMYANMEF